MQEIKRCGFEFWVGKILEKEFPGKGNGTPLQYSCLENPMERGAFYAIVLMVAKSRTRLKQLSTEALPGDPVIKTELPMQGVRV